MSNGKLPRFVDPEKMARKGNEIEGFLPVSEMKRVDGLFVEKTGKVTVKLNFFKDAQGCTVVSGSLSGEVPMLCQRCMERMSLTLSSEISLACVVTESQEKSLLKKYDPLIVVDQKVDLHELIEEELLLGLPVVPYHNNGQCNAFNYNSETGNDDHGQWRQMAGQTELISQDGPFAGLSRLKTYS